MHNNIHTLVLINPKQCLILHYIFLIVNKNCINLLIKVGACIVSPMKKIVAVGHHHKYCKAADDQTASTDQEDLERSMKDADLDFSKYYNIII